MELETMRALAQRMNVEIVHEHMHGDLMGLCIDDVIILSDKLDDAAKKCVLAEEIGHYFTAEGDITQLATVDDYNMELAGRKWGYEVLLPVSQIKAAMRVGIDSIKDIAELYKVTPEYVKEALLYYIYSGQLEVKEGGWSNERNIG